MIPIAKPYLGEREAEALRLRGARGAGGTDDGDHQADDQDG